MYNAAKYIGRCIESIYHQGLKESEFEVIIVNDGSTDDSSILVQKMSQVHPNLFLLDKENGGQGAARNYGLRAAKGEYIFFIDSDDYLPDDFFLPKLIALAVECKVDILEFEMLVFSKDGSSYLTDKKLLENRAYSGEQMLLDGFNPGSTCDKLFSRTFLTINNFSFETEIAHEDVEFLYRVYPAANKVGYSHTCGYVYYYNVDSTDRSIDQSKVQQGIQSDFYIAYKLKCMSEGPYSQQLQAYYRKRGNSLLCSLLLSFLKRKQPVSIKDIKKYLLEAEERNIFPVAGKTMSRKLDVFIPLLNCKFLYLFFVRILKSL